MGGREGEGAAFTTDVWHFEKGTHMASLSTIALLQPRRINLVRASVYKLIDSRDPEANANCDTLAAVECCQLQMPAERNCWEPFELHYPEILKGRCC